MEPGSPSEHETSPGFCKNTGVHCASLLRDNDAKLSGTFDEVFRAEGVEVIRTPVEAPKADAIAERFVGTVRRECVDWILIANRRHLEAVLRTFADHYNGHRPHRALSLVPPNRPQVTHLTQPLSASAVNRRDRLGGLIHEYRLRPDRIAHATRRLQSVVGVGQVELQLPPLLS